MDESRTVWCGNLSDKVTEELLYELFLQVAPLIRVRIPTDKEGRKSNFAFVTVKHEISVDYVVKLLNGTSLYNKRLNIRPRNQNNQNSHFGPRVDMKMAPGQSMMMNNFNELMAMGQMMQLAHSQHPGGQGFNADHRRDDYNRGYNNRPHHSKYENYNRDNNSRRDNNKNQHRNNYKSNDRNRRPRNYY